jgi:hypothetical protein
MEHVAVLPPTPTFPDLTTSKAMIAIWIKFRNSCAKNPSRSFSRTAPPSMVIAFALVLGDRVRDGVVRHAFRSRNSSTLIGALVACASSVMDWQTLP